MSRSNEHFSTAGRGGWKRVTPRDRCAQCGSDHWCIWNRNEPVLICMKTASAETYEFADGQTGWIHRQNEPRAPRTETTADVDATRERAPNDVLDRVYRFLLANMFLSDAHRDQLLARGLTQSTITLASFRSMPHEERGTLAEQIVSTFGESVAIRTPGLYLKNGKRWSIGGASGIAIPVFDCHGRIVSIRIRSESGSRYTYLSSSSHDGPSAATAVYIPQGVRGSTDEVRIVEGEIKAILCAMATGLFTIGVPGVGVIKGIPDALQTLGVSRVVVAYDQDAKPETRAIVERSRDRLVALCKPRPATIETWPVEAGKGLDDVIAAGRWRDVTRSEPVGSRLVVTKKAARKVSLPLAHPPASPSDAFSSMLRAISDAPDGLTIIQAETSLGKTHAAIQVAINRARTPYKTATAKGIKAPDQSKTVISVPTNLLAIQIAEDIRKQAPDVSVARVFGPLSIEGEHECRYRRQGQGLARGGQSVSMTLCQYRGEDKRVHTCEYYDDCKARLSIDGPENARIIVGNHALLEKMIARSGTTATLIIDEPNDLLVTDAWDASDLGTAIEDLVAFTSRYSTAMKPAIVALQTLLSAEEDTNAGELLTVLQSLQSSVATSVCDQASQATGETTIDGWVRSARKDDSQHLPPPLVYDSIRKAQKNIAYAYRIGGASRILTRLERAILSGNSHSIRVENSHIVLTSPNDSITRAIRRVGTNVILDANADLNAPLYARAIGYQPTLVHLTARDGASIERTLLRSKSANRSHWIHNGVVQWDAVDPTLRAVVRWIQERPCKTVAVIAYKSMVDGICDRLRAALPGVDVLAGWYGAIRGLNAMRDVDVLITIGDPWRNPRELRHDCAYLGIADPEQRVLALARAELEQAHGRIRPVHRQRPGRALHVGAVGPGGTGWHEYEERALATGGRASAADPLTPAEIIAARQSQGWTQTEAAREWGIDRPDLSAAERGVKPLSAVNYEKIRAFISSLEKQDLSTLEKAEKTNCGVCSLQSKPLVWTKRHSTDSRVIPDLDNDTLESADESWTPIWDD